MDAKDERKGIHDLPEPYWIYIASTLLVLDQRLFDMELWASGRTPSGPLYHWRQDLSPEQAGRIRNAVHRAHEELAAVASALGVEPREKVASSSVRAAATFSLIDLEDLRPARLREFGMVPEDKQGALPALWERLRGPLEEIRSACGADGESSSIERGEAER
jgi:hypothetical protein